MDNLVAKSKYFARSKCPCCDAPASEARPAISSDPPAEELPVSEHSNFLSGYTSRRVFFTYFRCGRCSALYCPTFYSAAQLETLYNRQDENMAQVPLEARRRTQQRYAELLMRYSTGEGDFLEIGADIGLLAEACLRPARFGRLWMYEPNYVVHEQLAARLRPHSHTILPAMSPGDEVPPGSISTAAMIHVLDHLLDPAAFLGVLHEKLHDNSVLLIVTHNTASLLARALGRRFPPFTLQHPQLYSPQSIRVLLDRAGFAVEEIADAVNYFPLMHLVRAGFSVFGLPQLWQQVDGPTIPIKLGNMATVARRRTRR